MKKILPFVFLAALFVIPMIPSAAACDKRATITYEEWPNGIVEVGEEVQWLVEIVVGNAYAPGSAPGVVFEDVVVTDRLGAELEIDSPFPLWGDGSVSFTTSGGSDKVKLTWLVPDMAYGQFYSLAFYVSTDINPAGHQEYTSPGVKFLNSGPTMKYWINGVQYSLKLNTIMITVYPKV